MASSSAKRGGLWWRPSGPSESDLMLRAPTDSSAIQSLVHSNERARRRYDIFDSFNARDTFYFPTEFSTCPPHTSRDAERLLKSIQAVDAVIEVRDARMPLLSGNYYLYEKIPKAVKRILVLNKVDLAPPAFVAKAHKLFEVANFECIKTSAPDSKNVIKIKERILDEIAPKFKAIGIWVMLIGLPNTGKSSLINALKRMSFSASKHGHAGNKATLGIKPTQAKAGPVPGLTREMNHFVISLHPRFVCLDTPGIMLPKLKDAEHNMKLAALGCIKDSKIGEMYIADWILYYLNQNRNFEYVYVLGLEEPSNDIKLITSVLTQRLRGLKPSIGTECLTGCRCFIRMFREGHFGKIALEELPEIENVVKQFTEGHDSTEPPGPWGPSSFGSPLHGL